MSTHTKKLLAAVIADAEKELKRLGFSRIKGVYVRALEGDVFGWLGLNTATHRSDGRVGINPVVGVRHERIENMVEELIGENEPKFSPTVSTALGYLMPEGRYLEWLIEASPFNCGPECQRMVEAIEVYGIPFMKQRCGLGSIFRDLEELPFTSKDAAIYRVPVAHWLAGEHSLAIAFVDNQIGELGDRNDPAARQYRTFASNLLRQTV